MPLGTGGSSLSQYVADCLGVLKKHGSVKYQLTPMGTIIEGPMDRVLDAVKDMHEVPFEKGVKRVVTTIKIDDRRDKQASMSGKVDSVLSKMKDKGKKS